MKRRAMKHLSDVPVANSDTVMRVPLTNDLRSGPSFKMVCCDCNLVHEFYFRLKDGKLYMRGDRNNEQTELFRAEDARFTRDGDVVLNSDGTVLFQILGDAGSEAAENHKLFTDSAPDARKDTPMTRRQRRRQHDANSPLDENGVLRDGATLRVSLFDAERVRSARFSAVDSAAKIAKDATEAMLATRAAMHGSGTAGDPYIIGGTQFSDADALLHKPGYRLLGDDDDPPKRRRKTVLRDPMGREKGTFEEDDSSLTPTEIAFREMVADSENAWRKPAPVLDGNVNNQGAGTRAIPASSATGDRWPLTAGAGNPCNTNGRPGKLVLSEDGSCLVCAVAPIQATRADSMSAEDAAKITGPAWTSMVEELGNAWR